MASEHPYFCKIPDSSVRGFRLVTRIGSLINGGLDLGRLDLGLESNLLTCHTRSIRFLGITKGMEGQSSGATSLLFDNSVRSGKTLHQAVKQLHRHNLHPKYFMKMVDYQDDQEKQIQAMIEDKDMHCLSVFTLEDVRDSPWLEDIKQGEWS